MTEKFIELTKKEIIHQNLQNLKRITICLNHLNEHQLWYKTNAQTNSVANLILHLCGNITQYISCSLGGEKDNRKRKTEFSIEKGFNKIQLLENISTCIEKANETIKNTTTRRLIKTENIQGFDMMGIGNLVHVCEHLSYHTGQIVLLTKIMTNKDLGFYADYDLDLTGKNQK